MADDVSIRDSNGDIRVMRGPEVSSKVYQTVALGVFDSTSSPTAAALFVHKASRQDTFITTGNGATINVSSQGMSKFGLQIKGTGAAASSYTVVLEGSLDGTNFSTILTHTNTSPGDGLVQHSGAVAMPVLYFRARCSALVLGSATNIVATIVGAP